MKKKIERMTTTSSQTISADIIRERCLANDARIIRKLIGRHWQLANYPADGVYIANNMMAKTLACSKEINQSDNNRASNAIQHLLKNNLITITQYHDQENHKCRKYIPTPNNDFNDALILTQVNQQNQTFPKALYGIGIRYEEAINDIDKNRFEIFARLLNKPEILSQVFGITIDYINEIHECNNELQVFTNNDEDECQRIHCAGNLMKSHFRRYITVDNGHTDTCEIDVSASHPTLLAAFFDGDEREKYITSIQSGKFYEKIIEHLLINEKIVRADIEQYLRVIPNGKDYREQMDEFFRAHTPADIRRKIVKEWIFQSVYQYSNITRDYPTCLLHDFWMRNFPLFYHHLRTYWRKNDRGLLSIHLQNLEHKCVYVAARAVLSYDPLPVHDSVIIKQEDAERVLDAISDAYYNHVGFYPRLTIDNFDGSDEKTFIKTT